MFVMFLDNNIQQMENILHSIMSLFTTIMHLFSHKTRDNAKKWKAITEMQKRRLIVKVKQNISSMENASSKKYVLCENKMSDTPHERSVQNKRDRCSA